mmetsp:Transcript_126313/g.404366  ORF Transcript_126313/g.404366 Transcript_126313/m.404366 type:complete len:247 (-) Transcript_126313:161-901(-)
MFHPSSSFQPCCSNQPSSSQAFCRHSPHGLPSTPKLGIARNRSRWCSSSMCSTQRCSSTSPTCTASSFIAVLLHGSIASSAAPICTSTPDWRIAWALPWTSCPTLKALRGSPPPPPRTLRFRWRPRSGVDSEASQDPEWAPPFAPLPPPFERPSFTRPRVSTCFTTRPSSHAPSATSSGAWLHMSVASLVAPTSTETPHSVRPVTVPASTSPTSRSPIGRTVCALPQPSLAATTTLAGRQVRTSAS